MLDYILINMNLLPNFISKFGISFQINICNTDIHQKKNVANNLNGTRLLVYQYKWFHIFNNVVNFWEDLLTLKPLS